MSPPETGPQRAETLRRAAADRRATGALGEKLALAHLKKRGYRIIETNYRCARGEVDIVARKKDCLVFVEVRTKRSFSYGSPEESISFTKKQRMKNAAYTYLHSQPKMPESWRIDVVAVELDSKGNAGRIEIIESAVGEE